MIFLKYRIRRLQDQVDVQKSYCEKLEDAANDFQNSYFTDRLLKEHLKWLELNSKLRWLKEKYEKRISR